MLILWREKLALLAVPKTGSTAIEEALLPYAAISYSRPPMVKHMTLTRFNRFMRPYLDVVGLAEVQTFAIMREPLDWLGSWYRYRQREGLRNTAKSTANLTFDEFVTAYMTQKNRPDYAEVGSQARFLSAGAKGKPIDYLFRYEDIGQAVQFLSDKIGQPLELPQVNVSPRQELDLAPQIEQKFRDQFADDFALYARISR